MDSGGIGTVADRLRQARRRRFVGRRGEIELLRSALRADEPPMAVLFVHGPGGVGKSALLGAFAETAAELGATPLRVDARSVDPSPAGFAAALAGCLGAGDGRLFDTLALTPRPVLLVDTYELLTPLDDWLREEFLPGLPASALVVIAGRNPPSARWGTDPGWRDLLRVIALRNLPPEDARAFLRGTQVAPALHDRLLAATHGHPLALSLLADVAAQRPELSDAVGSLADTPDVVRILLERFVEGVPGPRHRQALEVCAHTRFTTEDLLRSVMGGEDAAELFGWLRGLSFVEESRYGLAPHDVAREVLDADLRWRDRTGYSDLHRGIRRHLIGRIHRTTGLEQQRCIADIVFLHRANAAMRGYWEWSTFGRAYADEFKAADREPILAMTEHHQGREQARLAAYWMDRQPQAFLPIRASGREPIGYACVLALHLADEDDLAADPGARAMWEYARRHGPPRPGEEVFAARFFMDRDTYQRPSSTQNVITARHTQHFLSSPRLAWDFIGAYEDTAYWEPLFAYIDYHRAAEADYEIGGRRYGVFAHDWRVLDQSAWLEMMGERELGAPAAPPTGPAPELVLSHPEFADAVRAALRDLHRSDRLADNPLLRSRVVREHGDGGPEGLRALLREAADALGADARDERLHRAVDRTYFRPAQTQERAAEVLGLPFSTYRRHLARGVERIVEWMWRRELHGGTGRSPAAGHPGEQ